MIAFCWIAVFVLLQSFQIYLSNNKLSLDNLTIDYSKVYSFYQPKANKGDAYAQGILGSLYYNGKGVERNLEQALYWLQKSADQEDSNGQYVLGMMYYNGDGVKKDLHKASYLWARSSYYNAEAGYKVGMMYYKGEGVTKNLKYAYHFLDSAADKNHQEAKEKLKMLSWGKEIEKEMQKKKKYYEYYSKWKK